MSRTRPPGPPWKFNLQPTPDVGGAPVAPLRPNQFIPDSMAPPQAARIMNSFTCPQAAEQDLIRRIADEPPMTTPAAFVIAASEGTYYVGRSDYATALVGNSFDVHTVGVRLSPQENNYAAIVGPGIFRTARSRTMQTIGVRSRDWFVRIANTLLSSNATQVVMHHQMIDTRQTGPDQWERAFFDCYSIRLPEPSPVTLFIVEDELRMLPQRWQAGDASLKIQLVTHIQVPPHPEPCSILQHSFAGTPIRVMITRYKHQRSVTVRVPLRWFHGRFSLAAGELMFPDSHHTIDVRMPLDPRLYSGMQPR